MIQLKAAAGLGDAIYLRAIALHLAGRGKDVEIFTPWRDVFSDLPVRVRSYSEITGDEDWNNAKACLHCRILDAPDVFSMACLQAGVMGPVPFRLDWKVRNVELVARVKREAAGRKILMFQPLKVARNLNEQLSRPNPAAYAEAIEAREDHFRVMVGHPRFVQDMNLPHELNLMGQTSVADLFDIATAADTFFGEPSYIPTLADALGKPHTCMFSRRAIESGRTHIRNLKPDRLFHRPHLATVLYDEAECVS